MKEQEIKVREAAVRSKLRLDSIDCNELRAQIVDTAKSSDFFHIWMEVFADDAEMFARLNLAFR